MVAALEEVRLRRAMRKADTSSGRATDPLRPASEAISDGVACAAALLFAVPGRPVDLTQLRLRYGYRNN